ILIGKSSRDIVLRDKVFVKSTTKIKRTYHINSTIGDIMRDPIAWEKFKNFMSELEKRFSIPSYIDFMKRPERYIRNDCLRRMLFYYVRQGADMEEVERMFYKFIEELNTGGDN
ncbi:MAG: glycosyl hydrolase, partial [Dictyoglomus sp.]